MSKKYKCWFCDKDGVIKEKFLKTNYEIYYCLDCVIKSYNELMKFYKYFTTELKESIIIDIYQKEKKDMENELDYLKEEIKKNKRGIQTKVKN